MELKKKDYKKLLPNLTKELNLNENKVKINSIRTNLEIGEKLANNGFANYIPDILDFIRRCDTSEQAEEIINFLEKKGEIDKKYAEKLKLQLKKKGLRSFGPKKLKDYYSKIGGF